MAYRRLLQRYVSHAISADELEATYIELFTNDETRRSEREFRVLEDFFFDVDDYVADDALRDSPADIDEEELRRRALATLTRLDAPE
jgi:hypothetical protein